MQLKEDLLFAGRYKLRKLLGRGGFSEVWLANDEWTNLDVAVKVYAPGQGMDEDGLRDFCKELSNVYNLNHTNLLKPQHVDAWEEMPYLIMAYCENGTCYRQVGKFTEEETWKLIANVASGLAYLHEQGVIHQDIKPDNILVDNNGNYVITDFGISVQTRSTLRKSARNASTGGTTAYMAPERFSRDSTPVKASDIWSLGATVYELLTGRMPFGEVGGGMQRGGADIPTIKVDVSPALRQTITKMLAEDPWLRPTAMQLADWAHNPSDIELVDEVKVNPTKIDANPAGGESKVFVQADKDWRCFTEQQKWCSVEKIDHEYFVVKFKSNKTGEGRKTSVNIVAGPRASTVNVSQASLPKPKKWLVVAIASLVLALSAFVAWEFLKKGDQTPSADNPEIVKIAYEKLSREFDFWNSRINEDNRLTDTLSVMSSLVKLKEIEKMENNPKFGQLDVDRVFSIKLKAYRDNLSEALNAVDDELKTSRATWKDNPGSKFEDDAYHRLLFYKKSLIEKIMELSKNGSVKDADFRKIKE